MPVKFFGQFLLERKAIEPDQLLDAIEYQRQQNLKFGEYARKHGYVNDAEVERIQNLQKQEDIYFGEAAVKLDILGRDKVDEILQRQKNDHVYLGEALVHKGYLDEATLERELEAFREDQKDYAGDEVQVPETAGGARETAATAIDLTAKMLRRIVGIRSKIGTANVGDIEPPSDALVTRAHARGTQSVDYIIAMPQSVAVQISETFVGRDGANDEALVADSIREFVNIVCGNVVAKLTQQGQTLDLGAPTTVQPGATLPVVRGVRCDLVTPDGAVHVYVSAL